MWRSGFTLSPGGGDSRLVTYSLEHSYLFVLRQAPHRSFWDPPIFYPARNVAAYTDTLLGLAPFYWIFRSAGIPPDTTFQLWLIVIGLLNFATFFLFLRKVFDLGAVGASAGAFLFAFGSPRTAQLHHPQLVPHCLVVVALFALFKIFEIGDRADGRKTLPIWILVFTAALVIQAYAAFYPFFFCCFLLAMALVTAGFFADARRRLLAVLRRSPPALGLALVFAVVSLAPLARHYLRTSGDVGLRDWRGVVENNPTWSSWWLLGHESWLYGWIHDTAWGAELAATSAEKTPLNGVGLLTSVLAVAGLYRHRRRLAVRHLLLVASLAVLLATQLWPGLSLWRGIHEVVPGAGALRVVGRIGTFVLIPLALGLALFVETAWAGAPTGRRAWLLGGLALLVVAEQGRDVRGFDKIDARRRVDVIAAGIEPRCEAFFLSEARTLNVRKLAQDAMWAEIATGIPTLNGRYGNTPPGWDLDLPGKRTRRRLETALEVWIDRHGLDPRVICWYSVDASGEDIAPVRWPVGRQGRGMNRRDRPPDRISREKAPYRSDASVEYSHNPPGGSVSSNWTTSLLRARRAMSMPPGREPRALSQSGNRRDRCRATPT